MNTNNNQPTMDSVTIKTLTTLIILFSAIALLNTPILTTLWRHGFDDGTYSHAFLIPFISAYLYYGLAKTQQLHFREKLSFPFILLAIIACALLFITSNAQISLGYWGASLLVCLTAITAVFRLNLAVLFPAAFLVFIFPFWGLLVPFLQDLSIICVTFIMSYTGIPTFVEAEFITIPAGMFEIADGCSGLRYFIVSLAISSLYIFLYIQNIKKAALFFTVAILGALVTNWIRIAALIVIGEYTNMQSSLMEDHNTFGWYLYMPFLILLFLWGNKLADFDRLRSAASKKQANNNLHLPSLGLVILVIVISSTTIKSQLNKLPLEQASLKNIEAPIIHYASQTEQKTTPKNSEATYLIYKFDGNDLDGKPSYYENQLVPEGWTTISHDVDSHSNQIVVTNGPSQAVIVYRYKIGEQFYTNLGRFKIARLKYALRNINNTELHWLFTPCNENCKSAFNTSNQLLSQ